MTAQPATSPRTIQTPQRQLGSEVNFVHLVKSEWIKVTTVPSTVILIASTVIFMVGLAALTAWSFTLLAQSDAEMSPEFQVPMEGPGSTAFMALTVPSSGLAVGQLLIASLAVVLIASEWTTGMIRSTMVAVPKRIPALLAKTVVMAGIAFLIGVGSTVISYLIAQPILQGKILSSASVRTASW